MHERSLVRALLSQVQDLQAKQGAERVLTVRVSIGEFSGVESELVRSAFEEFVDDSPACGASLEVVNVPLESRCRICGCEFVVENFRFRCPQCGDARVDIIRGEGIVLESVTLE